MKTIGLIGGMSWESTSEYYKWINRAVARERGGLHSAKIILYSVNFDEIQALQRAEKWEEAGQKLADVARRLEAAGADFLVLCTNTMHLLADAIQDAVKIPLVHIVDALGERLKEAGVSQVGLIATRFTMERQFYRTRLQERFGIEVTVPEADDREFVHRVIFDELCQGKNLDCSRKRYVEIVEQLEKKGAQAVVLGCTEIGLLIGADNTSVPLFDTTVLHAEKAVSLALS